MIFVILKLLIHLLNHLMGIQKIIEYEKLVGKKLNLLILLDGLEIVGCIHQINKNGIIIIFLKFKQCNKKM